LLIERFIKKSKEFLGCKYPIMCGAMTWVSDHPFGVNLITLAPGYESQLDLVCKMNCKVVVFAGGIPKKREIHRVKESGANAICFAPTAPVALKLIDSGADALILEGSEAGGHIGPVALSILI
jgi:enoyl-[acyl-carrier protein] reductase II